MTTKTTTPEVGEIEQQKTTTVPHVVILGAGFGGLQAAKHLGKSDVRVTVIDHNNFHLFQPMLYQVASANLNPSAISIPIRAILRKQSNTEVLMAEVLGIDTQKQCVQLDNQEIYYDYLIIATGATSNYFGHESWSKLAPGMKTIDEAITVRRTVLSAFEVAEREPDAEKRKALMTFVLVGGGPTGVELAGAIADLANRSLAGDYRHITPSAARIILVEGEPRVMPSFPRSLTSKAKKRLQQLGVELRMGVHVEQVTPTGVKIGDEHVATENIIWTAGVKASPAGQWLHAEVDHDGRVKVQRDLTVPGHSNVYVIGDTALVEENGKHLPGLAPVAMQEGEYVASRIIDERAGKVDQKPFHYVDKGMLAVVGRSFGVVDIGPLHFTGFVAWLVWLLVHILFLIGFRNRVVVILQYTWALVTKRYGARVILPEDSVRTPS